MAYEKYIEISTMGIKEFAKSPVGTVAKFWLTVRPNVRQDVSGFITSACFRQRAVCSINSRGMLIEQADGSWLRTAILEVTMVKRLAK